jgi:hypothetical protein
MKAITIRRIDDQLAELHDLDHLFGQWSEEEFEKIQDKISRERQIDQELWQ